MPVFAAVLESLSALHAGAEGASTAPISDKPIVSAAPSPASPAAGACYARLRKECICDVCALRVEPFFLPMGILYTQRRL